MLKTSKDFENYDYSEPKSPMNEEEANLQLLWDERAKADCFLGVGKSCLEFVQEYQKFLDGLFWMHVR